MRTPRRIFWRHILRKMRTWLIRCRRIFTRRRIPRQYFYFYSLTPATIHQQKAQPNRWAFLFVQTLISAVSLSIHFTRPVFMCRRNVRISPVWSSYVCSSLPQPIHSSIGSGSVAMAEGVIPFLACAFAINAARASFGSSGICWLGWTVWCGCTSFIGGGSICALLKSKSSFQVFTLHRAHLTGNAWSFVTQLCEHFEQIHR